MVSDGILFFEHFERHPRQPGGMIGRRLRQTGDGHIGVTNGFDLLDPVFDRERVEARIISLSIATVRSAPSRFDSDTKPWMSENRIEAASNASAIASSGCCRKRSTIWSGRMLRSNTSVSASARSASRKA